MENILIFRQKKTNLSLANNLPLNSYSRKNVGYLVAIMNGAKNIIETDDDNFPYKSFLNKDKAIMLKFQNAKVF